MIAYFVNFCNTFLKNVKGCELLRENWTGVLVGKMHNHHVTQQDIADKLGCGKPYVSMILSGQRNPKDAKQKLNDAYDEIIKEREKWQKE